MKTIKHWWVMLLTLALCACGGGERAAVVVSAEPADLMAVSGRATKGPLDGATITFSNVDARGLPIGAPVGSVQTDAAGNWSATLPADHGGLLVTSTGGRFVDESDENPSAPRVIELGAADALLSFLPAGEQTVSITLVSDALVRKSRLETSVDEFAARLAGNRSQFTALLGLDPLATTAADPLAPQGSATEQRYALIAGGLAYALNSLAIEQGRAVADYAIIDLLLDDLLDCRVDGRGIGGNVLFDASGFDGRTLNDDILRFRNNHFAAYQGVDVPQLDAAGCPATAGTADSTPPVFTQTAPPLVLAAADASGTASDDAALTAALAAFAATDERAGAVPVQAQLPAVLPLGLSDVVVRAEDPWGNATEFLWSVEVRDQSPPSLTPPPDITVDASGPRTMVTLGTATALDNVTDSAALSITNDAPPAGFVVGDTPVTWQVSDAAGFQTQATQVVTVVGATPELVGPITPVVVAAGSAVDIDLSAFFVDPFDAPLSFSLAGLPAGSGLSLDAVSGRLSGTPNAADLAASPLSLTVTAANPQFTADAGFTAQIAAQVPAFALSQSDVTVDEDFGDVVNVDLVPVQPAPAGTVAYALTEDAASDGAVQADLDASVGVVSLRAVADASGVSSFTLEATNLLNAVRFTVPLTVTVNAVNDVPVTLVSGDLLNLVADEASDIDLATRFNDVDDATLSYTLSGAPASLSVTAQGRLVGVPTSADAAGGVFDVTLGAQDAAGASALSTLSLTVTVRDSDGDGLSDSREAQLGTDPAAIDSDGDGVDDGTEVLAGADPSLPATAVLYLSGNGANGNGGTSFTDAVRDHDGLTMIPPGASAAQPTFVLYAAGDERYGGSLWMMPPCDNIVFAGSIDPTTGVARTGPDAAPTSVLTALQAPSIEPDGCAGVRIANLAVTDSTRHAIVANNTSLTLDNVHLRGNLAAVDGGAVHATATSLTINGGVFSANLSDGNGGAISITGAGSALTMRHAVVTGNGASGLGGGIYFADAGGSVELANVLVTANAGAAGAGVYVDQATVATLSNLTLAFNQRTQPGDGAALAAADPTQLRLRDSVVAGNLDVNAMPSTLPAGLDSDFNSLDQLPLGPDDLQLAEPALAFGQGFALTAQAQAIDLGSTTALAAALQDRFALSGTAFADSGVVDRGYHYARGINGAPAASDALSASVALSARRAPRFLRYEAMHVRVRRDGMPLGSGHRVRLAPIDGRNDLINVVRLFDPVTSGDVFATDLGDGSYRVWRDRRANAATRFRVTVDGVVADSEAVLLCALNACPGSVTLGNGAP